MSSKRCGNCAHGVVCKVNSETHTLAKNLANMNDAISGERNFNARSKMQVIRIRLQSAVACECDNYESTKE